jgi:magnesium transporter
VRKGGLLPLPILAPPRAAEGKDGWALAKEEVVEEDEEEVVEVRKEGEEEDGGSGDGGGAREDASRGSGRFAADYISLGIKEPVYEVGGQ